MALTDAEQAELDRLIARKVAPEPRTETGVAGILHALIDSVSGAEAHRGPEAWAALHKQAEALAATPEPETPAPAEPEFPAGGTESTGFGTG